MHLLIVLSISLIWSSVVGISLLLRFTTSLALQNAFPLRYSRVISSLDIRKVDTSTIADGRNCFVTIILFFLRRRLAAHSDSIQILSVIGRKVSSLLSSLIGRGFPITVLNRFIHIVPWFFLCSQLGFAWNFRQIHWAFLGLKRLPVFFLFLAWTLLSRHLLGLLIEL